MRHAGALLEPIFLHLTADKTKERHDALARLRAVLDGGPGGARLATEQACRLLQAFVKMLRLELRAYLHVDGAEREMTAVQAGKVAGLAKDLRWLLGVLDAGFPGSHNHVQGLPDLYAFFLDALEARPLEGIHGDLLVCLRNFVLCRKAYLLEMRPEQWARLAQVLAAHIFGAQPMPVALEGDVMACLFFMTLAIPDDVQAWAAGVAEVAELLLELCRSTARRNHESPALCLLFRTINHVLHQLRLRDPARHAGQLARFVPLMLALPAFKTALVLEEVYLFFLANRVPPSPELAAMAQQEAAKSRLRPAADLCPVQFGDSVRAYLQRRQAADFPKGHVAFIVGLDFATAYAAPAAPLEQLAKAGALTTERLAQCLFHCHASDFAGLPELWRLFEASFGARRSWLLAMVLAVLPRAARGGEPLKRYYLSAVHLLGKHGSVEHACAVLAVLLRLSPELIFQGPPFRSVLESVASSILARPCIELATLHYGLSFRGLWWSEDAVAAYQAIAEALLAVFETPVDSRSLLDAFLAASRSLAALFSVPLARPPAAAAAATSSSALAFGGDAECLGLLGDAAAAAGPAWPVAFEVHMDAAQRRCFARILDRLRVQLGSQFEALGFQACKTVLAGAYQSSVREDTFAQAMLQRFDLHLQSDHWRAYDAVPMVYAPADLADLHRSLQQRPLDDALDMACWLKVLIQSYEFWRFKRAAKQDFGGSAAHSLWHVRPHSFLQHAGDRTQATPYLYMRLFLLLAQRVAALPAADAEADVFFQDFRLYLQEQFPACLAEAPVLLHLLPEYCALAAAPAQACADMVKDRLYRREELALCAMVRAVGAQLARKAPDAAGFVEPIVRRYLQWDLAEPTKAAALDMFAAAGLPEDTLLRLLLDPAPASVDALAGAHTRLLDALGAARVQALFAGPIWASVTCLGDALTRLKLMRLAVLAGLVELAAALAGLLAAFPRACLPQLDASPHARAEIHRLVGAPLLPAVCNGLLCAWLGSAGPLEEFPFALFGGELGASLAVPAVYTHLVAVAGVEASSALCTPSADFLRLALPRLAGVALCHYFSERPALSDQIFSQLLKRQLGEAAFEACFRDSALAIIHSVLELAVQAGQPALADRCLGHLAAMFKHESAAEVCWPAYMVQVLLLALAELGPAPQQTFLVTEQVLLRCPELLQSAHVLQRVLDEVVAHVAAEVPPAAAVLDLMRLLGRHCAGSPVFARALAAVLFRLTRHPRRLAEWTRAFGHLEGPVRAAVGLLGVPAPGAVEASAELDQIVAGMLPHGTPAAQNTLVQRLYDAGALLPATCRQVSRMLAAGELALAPDRAGEIRVHVEAQVQAEQLDAHDVEAQAEAGQPGAPLDAGRDGAREPGTDLLTEVLLVLVGHLGGASLDSSRMLFLALASLVNAEGICTASYWGRLPAGLRDQIAFLRVPAVRQRMLLPKFRKHDLPTPYGDLWAGRGAGWQRELFLCLVQAHAKNPLWAKLAFVCGDVRLCQALLPLVFEDCYFGSAEPAQKGLLAPIKAFLEAPGDPERFAIAVRIAERLLAQSGRQSTFDLDLCALGWALSKAGGNDVRALYFYEMGMAAYDPIHDEDLERLERLYLAVGAADYSGCFSGRTRMAQVAGLLDGLLRGPSEAAVAAAAEALWELQQWDLPALPAGFKLDQEMVDVYGILRGIAQETPKAELGPSLEAIAARCALGGTRLRALQAGFNFVSGRPVVFNRQRPGQIDLCLLAMSPKHQAELNELACTLLGTLRSADDLAGCQRVFGQLGNIVRARPNAELQMVLRGEQARLLWDKGRPEAAIDLLKDSLLGAPASPIRDMFLREHVATAHAQLGEWIFSSKSEEPLAIKQHYLDAAIRTIGNFKSNEDSLARIYGTYARFVDHMFDAMSRAENLDLRERLLVQARRDIEAMSRLAASRRDDAVLRSLKALEQQHKADLKEFAEIERSRTGYLLLAVENYLRCLQLVDKQDLTVFRVCSLWLQHYAKVPELSKRIATSIGFVPRHKFLPLIYQLAARAEMSELHPPAVAAFQETLGKLLFQMASKHPFHCIYQILALKHGTPGRPSAPAKRKLVFSTEALEDRRAAAAAAMVARLKAHDARLGGTVAAVERLCEAYIELANLELPEDTKANVPIRFGERWLIARLPAEVLGAVAIPTRSIPVDPTGQYGEIVTVAGFGDGFRVVGGINLPKIIECVGNDGRVYRQLCKGKDDVRQVSPPAPRRRPTDPLVGRRHGAGLCAGRPAAAVGRGDAR